MEATISVQLGGPSRWWLVAEVIVTASVVGLPLALGGAPAWTTPALFLAAMAAAAAWSTGALRQGRRVGWHPVLAVPLAIFGIALIQLIPLPREVLTSLSPPLGELIDFAVVPLGLSSTRPLSVDPPSTARAAARALSLGILVLVSLELARKPVVRRRLVTAVALTSAGVAAIGYVHLLAREDALLGVYHFIAPLPLVTPFGNTNHLAAFLSLGALVAIGLALSSTSRDGAIAWGVASLWSGVGVLMSGSRGGIGSFLAGLALLGSSLIVRRQGLRSVVPWLLMGATMTAGLLLSFEQLVERAASVSTVERLKVTKVELWPEFANAALAWWRTGMGVGTFELGFTRHQSRQLSVTFTHPENTPLQLAAELGLPLTIVLLVLVAWTAVWLVRGARAGNLEFSLLAAVVTLTLHDLFDFALELNAVPVAAAVVVGALAAASTPPDGRRRTLRAPAVVVSLVAILFAGLLLLRGLPTHLEAEAELADAVSRGEPPAEVRARAIAAIDRHPSDWVLYATAGRDAAVRGDQQEALAWINRVLFLRPADTSILVASAQALIRLGKPAQALSQLTRAWELGDGSSLTTGVALARSLKSPERLIIDRVGHLGHVYGVLMAARATEEARSLLETARQFGPSEAVQREAQALLAVHEVDHGDAAAALVMLQALPEQTPVVQQAQVRALSRTGRSDEAVRLLERLQSRAPSDLELGLQLVGVYMSQQRPEAALEVIRRLRPFAGTPQARSRLFQVEAQVRASQGRLGLAIEAMQTASRIEPQRPDLHYRLAELFEKMGSAHSALEELRKGRTLDTAEGRRAQEAWLERLETAAATPALGGSAADP